MNVQSQFMLIPGVVYQTEENGTVRNLEFCGLYQLREGCFVKWKDRVTREVVKKKVGDKSVKVLNVLS